MTGLNQTQNLGAQMGNFAALYCISRRSGHRILFFHEYTGLGKKFQLHEHFRRLPFELISLGNLSEKERGCFIFRIDEHLAVDSRAYQLDPGSNYNFTGLFHSYRNWYARRAEIADLYAFDPVALDQAQGIVDRAKTGGRQVVAVHVRRTDYFNEAHVNVARDYYDAAFGQFDDASVNYLVFSDDIAWCRENFADKSNVYYAEGATPIIDMAAMSLCDHNIIVNSTFGFWGAFLNRNPAKKVICPSTYLRDDKTVPYLNHAWYPDDFIGLDVADR